MTRIAPWQALRAPKLLVSACLAWGCGQSQVPPAKHAPAAEVISTTATVEGQRWLAATARAVERAGAAPLQIVAFGSGVPGDVVDAFVFVPHHRCALVYARGSESIEDLDLHAFGDDGSEFGSDEAPDAEPTLMLCPERDTRVYLTARVAQGRGLVTIGLHDIEAQAANAVARASGARNHADGVKDVEEPWPGLAETLQLHRRELGAHWIDQRRVALPVDSRVTTRITVTVPAERCLDALTLASEEVARLELLAEDEHGRIFARGRAKGPNRSLLFCAGNEAEDLKLLIRPHAGRGLAVLAVSTTRSPQDQLDLNPQIPVERLGSTPSHGTASLLPPPKITKKIPLTLGELKSLPLELKGCTRIDMTPDPALKGYSARVWSDGGALLSEVLGQWAGPLFVCGLGKVRFEAEATRTPGTLQIELRDSPQVPAPLISLPLAAGRLLSRMQSAGVIAYADDIKQVQQIALQEAKLHAQEVTIPPGMCLQAFVAKDEGGFGVEARLLDAESGLDLGFERGGTSLFVSSCATASSPVTASLQTRTMRGSAPALIALDFSPMLQNLSVPTD